ncbi:MAG: zinc-binding dehydrogenase [Spirochaetia bacterium]|nr:zinc-binding dehydrogenase [Spirochaetia bacterium]
MKVILLSKFGGPDILEFTEKPDPVPSAGEARVKIETIGLNYAEILSRKGQYPWAPAKPYILGMEAYGKIDMLGEGVKNRKLGQRVIVGTQYGAYAEYITVPANQTMPAIPEFSPEENAAFAVHYLTAWTALFEDARVRKGEVVLVHAAAGGVGSAAVQLLVKSGCHVIGVVGSDEKFKLVKKLGADLVLNYTKPGWEEIIREKYPNGVNVILNLVSGEIYRKSRELLAPLGKVVVVGLAGLEFKILNPFSIYKALRDLPRADVRQMMVRSYGISALHIGKLLPHAELVEHLWRDLVSFVRKHKIRPYIGAVFHFDQMSQAHWMMESRASSGKVVVKIP